MLADLPDLSRAEADSIGAAGSAIAQIPLDPSSIAIPSDKEIQHGWRAIACVARSGDGSEIILIPGDVRTRKIWAEARIREMIREWAIPTEAAADRTQEMLHQWRISPWDAERLLGSRIPFLWHPAVWQQIKLAMQSSDFRKAWLEHPCCFGPGSGRLAWRAKYGDAIGCRLSAPHEVAVARAVRILSGLKDTQT